MKTIDLKFNTPVCEVVFSNLQTPSKFDETKYSVRCSIDSKDAELIDKPCKIAWEQFCKDNGKKMAYVSPLKPLKDINGEDVPNRLVLKASRSAKRTMSDGETQIDNKARMFDSALQPVEVEPFRGSKLVLSVLPFAYSRNGNSGVSLRLIAVQVKELAECKANQQKELNATDFGFEAADGRVAEQNKWC